MRREETPFEGDSSRDDRDSSKTATRTNIERGVGSTGKSHLPMEGEFKMERGEGATSCGHWGWH